VTVTAAGPNSEGAESITYQVDNLMSGELPGPARTVPVSRFWQGPGGKSPVHIAVNDRFIFYYEKQQPSIIVARPLDGGTARIARVGSATPNRETAAGSERSAGVHNQSRRP
jgi:hypothetical protein